MLPLTQENSSFTEYRTHASPTILGRLGILGWTTTKSTGMCVPTKHDKVRLGKTNPCCVHTNSICITCPSLPFPNRKFWQTGTVHYIIGEHTRRRDSWLTGWLAFTYHEGAEHALLCRRNLQENPVPDKLERQKLEMDIEKNMTNKIERGQVR